MDTGLPTSGRALVVLARDPGACPVKTRLAAAIGAEAATEVYRAFLADLGRRLGADPRWRLHWAFSSPDPGFSRHVAAGAASFPQAEGDLGARMSAALFHLLGAGFPDVVLIGSDVPHVDVETIAEAFDALASGAPLVLGGAEDGGYYLVGAHERVPPIFDGMTWGHARVLEEALAAAARAGMPVRRVATAYDVDTVGDLRRLDEDIRRGTVRDLVVTRGTLERLFAVGYREKGFMLAKTESSERTGGTGTVWQDLRDAFSTLTILGPPAEAGKLPIGASGVFFPIVGLVVGFVVVVVDWMLRTFLSQEVTSVLLVAVLAVASAGRQLDGFANTCDGLIGFRGREWAIATMRDRRLGSFGVAAIVFLLILKVRSFDLLSDYRFAGILLPPMIGRAAIVALAHRARAAAGDSEGADFDRAISRRELTFACGFAAIGTIVVGGALGLLVAIVATLATIALRVYLDRRLGGVTGHTLDAAAETIETLTLVVFALAT
jgi:rSAM/selenodomain-associated transferase 1